MYHASDGFMTISSRSFFLIVHFKFCLAAAAARFCDSSTACITGQARSPGFLFFCVTLGRDVLRSSVYMHITEGVMATPSCSPHRVREDQTE